MKILLVAALFACACAAPSGVVLPAAAPTIDPGDLQAAVIDAQVKAEDQARALSESALEFNEKSVEQTNEKVIETDSLVKEKTEEVFWAVEDKKWQALDAVKTAEAKLDGAVANNADALAKSAFGGVVIPNYIPPPLLPTPLVRTPIVPAAPLFPNPYIPAPILPNSAFPAPFPATIIYAAPGVGIEKEGVITEKKEEQLKESVKSAELEKEKSAESEKKQEQNLLVAPSKEAEKPLLKGDKETTSEEKLEKPAPSFLPLVAPLKLPRLPQLPQLPPLTPVILHQPQSFYPIPYY